MAYFGRFSGFWLLADWLYLHRIYPFAGQFFFPQHSYVVVVRVKLAHHAASTLLTFGNYPRITISIIFFLRSHGIIASLLDILQQIYQLDQGAAEYSSTKSRKSKNLR